jgi:hypothetical protein
MHSQDLRDQINQLIDAAPEDPRAQDALRLILSELLDQRDQLAHELDAIRHGVLSNNTETEEAPKVSDTTERLRDRIRQDNIRLEQNYRDFKNHQAKS